MSQERKPADDAGVSERTSRATIERFLAALGGTGDIGAHLGDGVALGVMETGETMRGRDAAAAFLRYLHRDAFAAPLTATSLVVSGRRAAIEAVFAGPHIGEFAGIAATGRPVRLPYAAVCDVSDGAIAAMRLYLSLDALVRQLRDG